MRKRILGALVATAAVTILTTTSAVPVTAAGSDAGATRGDTTNATVFIPGDRLPSCC